MKDVQQVVMTMGVGILALVVLGRLALRWSARLKIREAFDQKNASIVRIRRAGGFLDSGSVLKAITSMGYMVTILTQDGRQSDLFCLVRYIPMVGFAWGVEIWSNESDKA